jgi:hypothetical protein
MTDSAAIALNRIALNKAHAKPHPEPTKSSVRHRAGTHIPCEESQIRAKYDAIRSATRTENASTTKKFGDSTSGASSSAPKHRWPRSIDDAVLSLRLQSFGSSTRTKHPALPSGRTEHRNIGRARVGRRGGPRPPATFLASRELRDPDATACARRDHHRRRLGAGEPPPPVCVRLLAVAAETKTLSGSNSGTWSV